MAVTIKQIAQFSGVSRGTVDRVLNNRGGVKKEVCDRVLKISKELGYEPNILAKALSDRTKSPKKIVVIINSQENPFYDDVILGIEAFKKEIVDYGTEIILKTLKGYDETRQIELLDLAIEDNADGIVVSPINSERIRGKLEEIDKLNIPVVTINTDIENVKRIAYVGCDYFKTGETAAGMLGIASGGEVLNVGIITGSLKVLGHNLRVSGFKSLIKNEFSNIHVVQIIENDDNDITSYGNVKRMLQDNKDINALYFTAAGVRGGIIALKELGIERKVKIVTFDMTPIVRESIENDLVLATICQEPFKQGYESLKILFDYIIRGVFKENDIINTNVDIKIKYNL